MLERAKHRHVVAPAINWLYATVYEAEPYGYTFEKAEQVGYKKELEVAYEALKKMHKRNITVLPGGDYGFAWCPHGTYARDLEHFVKLLDFTPMESIVAATAGVAKLFMQENELGKILPGYYADCILVDGDPLKDISVLQKHDQLNVIMINGRIHKSSKSDFMTTPTSNVLQQQLQYKFVAYQDKLRRSRVGHLDEDKNEIQELSMSSGAALHTLQQVIALGNDVALTGDKVTLSEVKILPPIGDRDVLCVGNNYSAHVKEYRESAFGGSERHTTERLPTIFTKRKTSVIASGDSIYSHPEFTSTLDYEGEMGVIIGKSGFNIKAENAMDYVWGYTIINDVTAREKQRDHGQFLMGKSPDTFCPMGPVAVPAASLSMPLRVQTKVNGELRQDGTTDMLITPIPQLIETSSQGLTLEAGDVIATGTPAGVGVGMKPPCFMTAGDSVEVSIEGIGKLVNPVLDKRPPTSSTDPLPVYNIDRTWGGVGLVNIGDKSVHVHESGSGSDWLVFVHGLGASCEYYRALTETMDLSSRYRVIAYDFEGHGLTSTAAANIVTLETLAEDLVKIFTVLKITRATVVGWSIGALVAMLFAQHNATSVDKLVLLGPGPNPFPEPAADIFRGRAKLVRAKGMVSSGVCDTVANAATSAHTQQNKLGQLSAVRQYLSSTHPEGYAKGCMALALSTDTTIEVEKLCMPTLIVAGDEDKISPISLAEKYKKRLPDAKLKVLHGTGHWHVIEDLEAVADALRSFL